MHARWSEHHRPVASGSHTARCTITRQAGQGSLDGDGVWHPPSIVTVYTGPCRITAPSPTSVRPVGEQQVATAEYEITIRWDAAEVTEHDLVKVTEAKDPGIVGKEFVVTDVRYAAERFERVLKARFHLTEREV
jgi:hypothetical protein